MHYEVSESLLHSCPSTMLARSASKQWHEDPESEIFIERDSERFRLVLDYIRDGHVSLPVGSSKDALLTDLQYYGFDNIKADDIEDKPATTFLYGQCTMLVQDLLKSWDSKIYEHQHFVRELMDSKTILCAFSSTKSLTLYNLTKEGRSFTDCNELLKQVGLFVVNENGCRGIYSVNLKLI